MRAVVCRAWGGPRDLEVGELPEAQPGPGQVRIRVHAAGLNFADTLMIAGKYQVRPPLPFAPGLEAAGVVDACGDGVTQLAVGDRVAAATASGAFAEQVLADVSRVFRIPDSMPFDIGAAFLIAYGTSHVALRHRADLQPGETLLVHGAGGGVGLTAVEIGHHMGARVIATAGSAEKLELARSRGAEVLIDYSREDIREQVKAATGGRGADVIYDPVGGDVFDASLRCINWAGRLLVVGFAAGRIPQIPANYLLLKNCAAMGVFWGAYQERDPDTLRASMQELLDWYQGGALRPHISMRLPMARVADGLEALLERRASGKVVLQVA